MAEQLVKQLRSGDTMMKSSIDLPFTDKSRRKGEIKKLVEKTFTGNAIKTVRNYITSKEKDKVIEQYEIINKIVDSNTFTSDYFKKLVPNTTLGKFICETREIVLKNDLYNCEISFDIDTKSITMKLLYFITNILEARNYYHNPHKKTLDEFSQISHNKGIKMTGFTSEDLKYFVDENFDFSEKENIEVCLGMNLKSILSMMSFPIDVYATDQQARNDFVNTYGFNYMIKSQGFTRKLSMFLYGQPIAVFFKKYENNSIFSDFKVEQHILDIDEEKTNTLKTIYRSEELDNDKNETDEYKHYKNFVGWLKE